MAHTIELETLTKSYGSRRGIADVTLAADAGSLVGFLGPNGAGKTTTIRLLLGLLRPSAGHARILGRDCWRDSHIVKRDVGSLPGDLRLWPWLNGHAALSLFGQIRGIDLRPRGKQLADELELDLALPVRKMSRGNRQKLGIVLALAHQPRVLVLDEPTTALDPLMQDRLRVLLRQAAQGGACVFFSSHTLGEVEALCERVAIVRGGRIIADSTLSRLRADAGFDLDVRWKDPSTAPAPPPWLVLSRHRNPGTSEPANARWVARFHPTPRGEGSLADLLALLHTHRDRIEDVRFARPDLETLFRRYYEGDDLPPQGGQP